MKKILFVAALVLSWQLNFSQTTVINDANAERRSIGAFSGISVAGGIDAYLVQGNEDGVAVSASETKYRERIHTEVKDGVLHIWYENHFQGLGWNGGHKKLRAYISFKNINKLKASGSSDVFVTGTLRAADLEIELSGSSDLKGAVEAEHIKAGLSGSSDIIITGKANALDVSASGSSDFKNYDFVVQTCDAHVSGSSSVKVTVEKELNGTASGSSDINVKGNGVIKTMSTKGSSSIKKV